MVDVANRVERSIDHAESSLRARIMGCWLGKAVGGTLGQTFEGLSGPLTARYYHPVPTSMVPNDDLDLQVVFACVLAALERPRVDRAVLGQAWAKHVEFPWNEYGVAMRNYAEGLRPPFTGSFDNWFTAGEGAAIRSELWACLAAGDPDLAGRYAFEDACFDHAGVGIDAAVFLARLESAAFVQSDPDELLDVALAGLPEESQLRAVVQRTRDLATTGVGWEAARELLVDEFANSDFTDVRINTAFVILGWLYGKDFSERITITNACGSDTDSSTATLGALLGILGPDEIGEQWLRPIGRNLVLNPQIVGIQAPETLEGFTDLVLGLRSRLAQADVPAASGSFEPATHAIPVEFAFTSSTMERWSGRDLSELPPPGAPAPVADFAPGTLPGTWTRMPRDEFTDRILLLRYQMHARGRREVRLMFNCTEEHRIWLNGAFLHAAQGSNIMFPAPHMAPVGQFVDLRLDDDGPHELVVAVKRPPALRPEAEWVIALTERPSQLWVENAFRPTR